MAFDQNPAGPASLPPGRYGRAPSAGRRRAWRIGIGALAAAGVALVVWLGIGYSDRPVRWSDVGFDVVSSERIDVTFEVTMKPGTTAVCTLDALATNFAQVGTVDIRVGPSEQTQAHYTATIATSELATTGVVSSCAVD